MTLSEQYYGGTSHTPSAADAAAVSSVAEHALEITGIRVLRTALSEVATNGATVTWQVNFVVHRDDRDGAIAALGDAFFTQHLTQDLWALGGTHLYSQWQRIGAVLSEGIVYV